nr:hypothetical protein [Tanacetum cinerariifolium]
MPSFVTHDSPDLLKSSSRDTTEPITTIGVAPQSTSTNGCTESDTRRRKRGAPGSLSESHIVQQCINRGVRLRAETDLLV